MVVQPRTWGYVYIIRSLSRYKIGFTGNLRTMQNRLTRLHLLNAFGIEKVLILRSRRAHILEIKLHQQYAHKRNHGEWFDLTPEDIQAIQKQYIKEVYEVCDPL